MTGFTVITFSSAARCIASLVGLRALSRGAALALTLILLPLFARAHEVVPAIGDLRQTGDQIVLTLEVNLEAMLAGVDQSRFSDTNDAPEAAAYDRLRALSPQELAEQGRGGWARLAQGIVLKSGDTRLFTALADLEVLPAAGRGVTRISRLSLVADLPAGSHSLTFAWDARFGSLVLRQQGVEEPYTGYLENGATSENIALSGGGARSGLSAFVDYVPVGFRHILPLGIDHILFVLGLFFLSTHWRPLLWQVSAFTVAHTITLALAAAGLVRLPASIVEPLIAASIVFVAVENIFTSGLSRWRPFVVFGFGLLHGLGFASVLGAFGLPEGAFFPALIGFNVGVELGQLTVIAAAFGLVGYWFGDKPWYRRVISIPASVAIALIGAWWVVERTLL